MRMSLTILCHGTPEMRWLTSNQGKNVPAIFAKLDRLSRDVAFRASAGELVHLARFPGTRSRARSACASRITFASRSRNSANAIPPTA